MNAEGGPFRGRWGRLPLAGVAVPLTAWNAVAGPVTALAGIGALALAWVLRGARAALV